MATRDHAERGDFRPDGEVSPRDTRHSLTSIFSDDSATLHGDDSSIATRQTFGETLTSPTTSTAETLNSIIENSIISADFFRDKGISSDRPATSQGEGQRTSDSERSNGNTPTEPARYRLIRNTHTLSLAGGNGGGNFRGSRTWVSPDNQLMARWTFIRNSMRRLFRKSEVAQWKYGDYIAHREAMLGSQKNTLTKTVSQKEQECELGIPQLHAKDYASFDAILARHNLTMEGNASRVLGEKTIWCIDWMNGKDEIAPWPTIQEMKWEGDDRAKTAVGRFPAIPREIGAPGIPWNQLQAVEVYPLDEVWRVPQMDDILLPVDEIEEDEKCNLLNSDIEAAIDEYLES